MNTWMANGPMDVWVLGLIDGCLFWQVDFWLREFMGESVIVVINFLLIWINGTLDGWI